METQSAKNIEDNSEKNNKEDLYYQILRCIIEFIFIT